MTSRKTLKNKKNKKNKKNNENKIIHQNEKLLNNCNRIIPRIEFNKTLKKERKSRLNIVLFTRDLRKDHNELLQQMSRDKIPILAVFIFDPKQIGEQND